MNEKNREDFIRSFRRSDVKTSSQVIQKIEGHVSDNNTGYTKEQLSFIDGDATSRDVTIYTMSVCNCGAVLSQKNSLYGKCRHPGCSHYVCNECVSVCSFCRMPACPRHSKKYRDGTVYCNRCRPVKWLKIFFDLTDKENEK